MNRNKMELDSIPSPRILSGNENIHYRDPAAIYHEGIFHLFFTVNHPRNDKRSMVSVLGTTTSQDLINWSPVRFLTAENPSCNYCSPGNIIRFKDEWIMCVCSYPIPTLEGFIGNENARAFIMRSKDLETWSSPQLIKLKGPDVGNDEMGRIIDPYLIRDKDKSGKWWCSYKQNGVSISYSYDLETWTYAGRHDAGENTCVLVLDDEYYMLHCRGGNGMGLIRSNDMKQWVKVVDENITLGYGIWPWAMARLTAGFVLDLRHEQHISKYIMFFHATESHDPHEHIGNCSLGIAWSDDLISWHWPKTNDN